MLKTENLHSFSLHAQEQTFLKRHQKERKCRQENLSSKHLAAAAMRHHLFICLICFNLGRTGFVSFYSFQCTVKGSSSRNSSREAGIEAEAMDECSLQACSVCLLSFSSFLLLKWIFFHIIYWLQFPLPQLMLSPSPSSFPPRSTRFLSLTRKQVTK